MLNIHGKLKAHKVLSCGTFLFDFYIHPKLNVRTFKTFNVKTFKSGCCFSPPLLIPSSPNICQLSTYLFEMWSNIFRACCTGAPVSMAGRNRD